MELYRICKEEYSKSLVSSGVANRWNKDGEFVIYASSSRALATLELVVHRSSIKPDINYKVMILSVPDFDHAVTQVKISDLPIDWQSLRAYSTLQTIGSEWYKSNSSLLLKIPSAIIPLEYNYIINTKHPDFNSQIKLVRREKYFWDERV